MVEGVCKLYAEIDKYYSYAYLVQALKALYVFIAEIVVKLCRRTSPTSHYSEILGTFVVLKVITVQYHIGSNNGSQLFQNESFSSKNR